MYRHYRRTHGGSLRQRGFHTRHTEAYLLYLVNLLSIFGCRYHERGKATHEPTVDREVEPSETDRRCEQYVEPKYWVVSENCEVRDSCYRHSKVVNQPKRYSCGRCDGDISVEKT